MQQSIEEWYRGKDEAVLIDVRTPAEFAKGHIPAAHNLPLFSNAERAEVGTLYKQKSPEAALLKGLEIVGPKMRSFVEEAREIAPERQVVVHCWRGGQRSGSMGWLLETAGFQVHTLKGGYKAYRNYILKAFGDIPRKLILLGGPTGSGKTEVLHQLSKKGEYIIDLEGIANHKGSAFGALGEDKQPSTEQFENDLYEAVAALPGDAVIWLESESKSIGRVYIPNGFWAQMSASPMVLLDIPKEERIKRLVADYASFSKEDLKDSFERIRKRLGGQHVKAACAAIDAGDFAEAADIGLRYYDKSYRYAIENKFEAQPYRLQFSHISAEKIANQLIELRKDIWK
jgi:tRNA 2-selenouridine synthase